MANEIKITENFNLNKIRLNDIRLLDRPTESLFSPINNSRLKTSEETFLNRRTLPSENTIQGEMQEIRILNNIRRDFSNRSSIISERLINFLSSNGLSVNKIDLSMLFRAMRESLGNEREADGTEISRLTEEYNSYFFIRDEESQRLIMASLLANNAPINPRLISFAESELNRISELENLNEGVILSFIREDIRPTLRNIYASVFRGNTMYNQPIDNPELKNDIINLLKRRNIDITDRNIEIASKFVFNFIPVNNENINKYNYLSDLPQNTDVGRTLNIAINKFLSGKENDIPVFLKSSRSNTRSNMDFISELRLMNAEVNKGNISIMNDIFNNINNIPYNRILNRDFTLREILNYVGTDNFLPTHQNMTSVKLIDNIINNLGRTEIAYVISRGRNPLDLRISELIGYISDYREIYNMDSSEILADYAESQQNTDEMREIYNAIYFALNSPYNSALLNTTNLRISDILDFYKADNYIAGEEENSYLNQSLLNRIYLDNLARALTPERLEDIINQNLYSLSVEEIILQYTDSYSYNTNDRNINYINQILKTNPHTILWMQSNGIPFTLENISISQTYDKNRLIKAINSVPTVMNNLVGNNLDSFEKGRNASDVLRDMYFYIEDLKKSKLDLQDIKILNNIQNLIYFQNKLNEDVSIPIKIGNSACNLNINLKSNSKEKTEAVINISSNNFKDVDFFINLENNNLKLSIYSKSSDKLNFIKDNISELQGILENENIKLEIV